MGFDFQERTNKMLHRLRILGVWSKHDFCRCDWYFLYSICVIIYYNFHNVSQVVNLIQNYDDLEEVASSGLLTLVKLFTNIKAYCIIRNNDKILQINKTVQKKSFQPRNAYQEKIALSTFKIFDVMYITHFFGPTTTILFFALYPIAELLKGKKKLPFNAWYPYNYTVSPMFELTYAHQLTGSFTMAQIQVHTDCLSINMIAIIIAQLDFLADNVRNISRKKYQQSEQASEIMEAELVDCIEHHKEILSCFQDVYGLLNIIMFAQFSISTVSMCLTLLELSVLSPASTHFAALVIYISALMVELLLFCWWGNLLIVRSQLVPQAAFECDWLNASITFRKHLTFFIFRCQKEMALYAVDFFKISLGSFVMILKNSYSFYAVLHQANNNDATN